VIGLVAIVMAVWLAAEVYTRGIEHAFGGVLAGSTEPLTPRGKLHSGAAGEEADDEILVVGDEPEAPVAVPHRTPVQNIGAHVQGEIDASYDERYRDE
jgi:hypothetical protein